MAQSQPMNQYRPTPSELALTSKGCAQEAWPLVRETCARSLVFIPSWSAIGSYSRAQFRGAWMRGGLDDFLALVIRRFVRRAE